MNILVIETKRAGGEWKPEPSLAFENNNDGAAMALRMLASELERDIKREGNEPFTNFRLAVYIMGELAPASTEVSE